MQPRGFTLVEMLVSVAIFATVMVISLGALLAMAESDRKSQTLKSVINNLNFSLDSISRSIRTGFNHHCGSSGTLGLPQDCASGGTYLIYDAAAGVGSSRVAYCRGTTSSCDPAGTAVLRSTDGGVTFAPITSSEVVVSNLSFYVIGAESPTMQTKVTILISGAVQVSANQQSLFNLQTSVTQRLYEQP